MQSSVKLILPSLPPHWSLLPCSPHSSLFATTGYKMNLLIKKQQKTPTDHPCTNEEPVSNRLMVSVNMLYLCASKCVHDWWSSRRQVVDFLLVYLFFFHKRAVLDDSQTSLLCPFQSLLVGFVGSVSTPWAQTPKWSSSGFMKNHTVQFNWAKWYFYCGFRALLR